MIYCWQPNVYVELLQALTGTLTTKHKNVSKTVKISVPVVC